VSAWVIPTDDQMMIAAHGQTDRGLVSGTDQVTTLVGLIKIRATYREARSQARCGNGK